MPRPKVTFSHTVTAQQAAWFNEAADAAYDKAKAAGKAADKSPIAVGPLKVEATLPAPAMEAMNDALKEIAKAGWADGLAESGAVGAELIE